MRGRRRPPLVVLPAPARSETESMTDLDGTLIALSDPTRRGVIDLLRRKPRRAGELSAALEMSPAAMSRHLRVLRTHGLVEEDHAGPDARVRIYRLRRGAVRGLGTWGGGGGGVLGGGRGSVPRGAARAR